MSRVALSTTLVALAMASLVSSQTSIAQFPATPLISEIFPHPSDAPEQVYPLPDFLRAPQTGYNICNSTTENQQSMCQTAYINSLSDFCLWAPPTPNTTIADSEALEVAWCTDSGHGTRIIPPNTLQGVQYLIAPDYIMITGLMDQSQINIQAGDEGGELDSGGQDTAGNPLGGLMYSTAFGDSNPDQILFWTTFVGSNMFCAKICKPNGTDPEGYCKHTLDRIGLSFNCPSKYTVGAGMQPGEFEVCESDDITVPGVYVDSNGVTQTYTQPAESLGPITTVPYSPTPAASSNCVTTASSALFTAVVPGSPSSSGSASASGPTSKPSGSSGSSGSPTRTGSSGSSSPTGASQGNGANTLHLSVWETLVGTLFAVVVLG